MTTEAEWVAGAEDRWELAEARDMTVSVCIVCDGPASAPQFDAGDAGLTAHCQRCEPDDCGCRQ